MFYVLYFVFLLKMTELFWKKAKLIPKMKPFVKVMRLGGVMPVATNLSIVEDFDFIRSTIEARLLSQNAESA